MKSKTLSGLTSIIVFSMISLGCAFSQGNEVRAVWLTTFGGLDWPKSVDPSVQRQSLRRIVDHLASLHFNMIFFQVRSRGDAFYRSSFEPWARELTGSTGNDPGWDPLEFLLTEAHARGIEVHAWLNVYKVWGASPVPFDTDPPHILSIRPEWAKLYQNEWWLDPGIPSVNEYILAVALDLIEKYPLDGMHFDHIRYPGRDFDDSLTFALYGGGVDLHQWRRNNITVFVREFYRLATAIRPSVKIGSAPIGVYGSLPGFNGSTAFTDYYQDPELWLREEIHDYIVPQIYWDIPDNPRFDVIAADWTRRSSGRHIYGGLGIFKPEIALEVERQVEVTRALALQGQAFFRYEHLLQIEGIGRLYRSRAEIPAMPWKIRHARNSTRNTFSVSPDNLVALGNMFDDSEYLPESSVGARQSTHSFSQTPQQYIIYRSPEFPVYINNPGSLAAVLPATADSFKTLLQAPDASDYIYLVSRLFQSEAEDKPENDEFERIARLLGREYFFTDYDPAALKLEVSMCTPSGGSYELILGIGHPANQLDLYKGYLDPGIHTIGVPAEIFSGRSELILKTGRGQIRRSVGLTE